MARKRFDRHIVQATALILMSALLLCACDSVPTDSTVPSVSESATDTSASDSFGDDDDFYFEDPYPVKMTSPKSSDGSDASNGSDNDGDDDGNDALDYLADSGDTGTFDKLIVRNNDTRTASRFAFLRNGQVVLGFEAGKIFFNKPSGKTIE